MILCALSPLFYFILKKLPYIIFVLIVCWIGGYWLQIEGFSITGVLFFSLGAVLSIHNINPIKFITKRSNIYLFIYLALSVADLFTRFNPNVNHYLHAIGILVGIFVAFIIAYKFARNDKMVPSFLYVSTFFVYAFHGLIVHIVKPGLVRVIKPDTNIGWIGIYITVFLLLFLISYFFYRLTHLLSPRFCKILCGNR